MKKPADWRAFSWGGDFRLLFVGAASAAMLWAHVAKEHRG
jgi:hypothetical protein